MDTKRISPRSFKFAMEINGKSHRNLRITSLFRVHNYKRTSMDGILLGRKLCLSTIISLSVFNVVNIPRVSQAVRDFIGECSGMKFFGAISSRPKVVMA